MSNQEYTKDHLMVAFAASFLMAGEGDNGESSQYSDNVFPPLSKLLANESFRQRLHQEFEKFHEDILDLGQYSI